jgi:short-subunit dehydrogenase
LQNRRVLITGASGGIGRSIAERAARRGARVAVSARSADKLDELVQSLNVGSQIEAIAIPADVTLDADRERILQTVVERFGGLDVLINNAGVASFGHFATSSEDVLRKIMEVNFFAPVELIRRAIPLLQKGEQPAIVNVASMCGRRGLPAWPEYSASKFALCGMTEALRGEMARFDIDVLLILPGLTKSDLGRHLLRNEGKMKITFDTGMEPAEVAEGVLRALEANRTETVLGSEAKWMLRLQTFAPRLLDRLIARKVRRLYQS